VLLFLGKPFTARYDQSKNGNMLNSWNSNSLPLLLVNLELSETETGVAGVTLKLPPTEGHYHPPDWPAGCFDLILKSDSDNADLGLGI